MPILPEVRQEYSLNVGQTPEVSGNREEAAMYGAIGQLSQNVGKFAAGVARDLHVQAADLETNETISKYKAETAAYYDLLRRDSELDFVKGSNKIATEFKNRQAARRQSLLDGAGSYLAKSQIESQLAGADAEESLKFLSIKQERIVNSKDAYLQKTQNNFAASLVNTTSTFDDASRGYMNLVNDVYATFKDYMPEDERQKFLSSTADQGATAALSSYLSRGAINQAAAQFFGPDKAKEIVGRMKANQRSGKDPSTGLGTRIDSKPGFYLVKTSATETKEIQLPQEIWDSSPYAFIGDEKTGVAPVGVTYFPQDGILKDITPQTRMSMFEEIMKNLSKKPTKDASLSNQKLNSALALVKNGELSNEALRDLVRPEVLDDFDKSGLAKAGSIIAGKIAQEAIKRIENQKVSRQDEMLNNLDAQFPTIMKSIHNDPAYVEIATRLGDGDYNKGREELDQELTQRKVRDMVLDSAMKRQASLEKDAKEDIAKVARKKILTIPQIQQFEDTLFAQGGILKAGAFRTPEGRMYKDYLREIKSKAGELSDAFGTTTKLFTNDTAARVKTYFKSSYEDAGQLTNLVSNFKDILDDHEFNTFMSDQLEAPGLAVAVTLGNYTAINELARAYKYTEANKKALQDDDKFKDFREEVVTSSEFENVRDALMKAANSSQPAVAEALREDFISLASYYKSSKFGMSNSDAIKAAANTLIYKDHDVLIEKKSWIPGSAKRNISLIIKKSEGVDSNTVRTAIESSVGNKEWLRSQAIPYPKEVLTDAKMTGDYDRFLDYVVDNYSARTGPNGVELGFIHNKTFVPLPNNNGGFLNLRIRDIKVAAKKAEELKNKKRYKDVESAPSTMVENKRFVLSSSKWNDQETKTTLGKLLLGDDNMSNQQFLTTVSNTEIDDFNKLENPNIARDYNKILTNTFRGITAKTLGGSMTASALRDVMDFRGLSHKGLSNDQVLEYFQKGIKNKEDFFNIQKDFMLKNKQNIKTQLAPLENNAQRFFIMDLANVIGAGAVNKYRLGEVLANKGFAEVERILDSDLPYVVQDGITKTLSQVYRGNILGNEQRKLRHKKWASMM